MHSLTSKVLKHCSSMAHRNLRLCTYHLEMFQCALKVWYQVWYFPGCTETPHFRQQHLVSIFSWHTHTHTLFLLLELLLLLTARNCIKVWSFSCRLAKMQGMWVGSFWRQYVWGLNGDSAVETKSMCAGDGGTLPLQKLGAEHNLCLKH
jgi:hypothetical protein